MRDPWKVLAAVLGFCLLLAAAWRFEPAVPQAPARAEADTLQVAERAALPDGTAAASADDEALQAAGDAQPQGPVTLLVRLTQDGKILENAGCQLRAMDRTPIRGDNFSGTVIFRNLEPGEYSLLGTGRGFFDRQESLLLPGTPALQEHEMRLESSARVEVYFLAPSGERLAEVLRRDHGVLDPSIVMPSILATESGGVPTLPLASRPYRNSVATWDEAGYEARADHPDGWLALRRPAPLQIHAMLHHLILDSRLLDGPRERLEWTIDPAVLKAACGSIRVRILDPATGAPPPKSYLALEGSGWFGLIHRDDGWYERDFIPPGVYLLDGRFASRRVQVEAILRPGETTLFDGIYSKDTASLVVSVRRPDGSAATDAKVLIHNADARLRADQGSHYGSGADAQSLSTTMGVPHGLKLVLALPPQESGLAPAWCEVLVPQAAVAEILLQQGRPAFLVPSRPLVYGESLIVYVDERAALPAWHDLELPARARLAPGWHAWALLDGGGAEIRRGRFQIEPGQDEVRVEAELP